jgi:NDP-sugar pyrophosphorylase family protein
MKNELNELKSKIASFKKNEKISSEKLKEMKGNTTVVFMAGGLSSRFSEVSKNQKSAFQFPNGETMIEIALKMYINNGFKKFAVLVSYQAEEIIKILGNGERYNVSIKYSHDPKGSPIGKGGALRNALDNGTIPTQDIAIIQNTDDVILDIPDFPEILLSNFSHAIDENYEAMVVVVTETPYEFSGMKVVNNEVTELEMYPKVPIPAHVGVSVLSPKIYPYFREFFNYEQKTDFEKVLFPILTKEKKLYAMEIPEESWIAVNNLKSYNKLLKRLGLTSI